MESKEHTRQNAVESLNFGSKTAKRATFEAFEFTIVGPNRIEVANASYGDDKDEHTYEIKVEDRDGVAVPVRCECPADEHTENYACKHRVGCATVAGPTVLNAALEFESPAPAMADGGVIEETCPNGDPECDGPESKTLPCFECYTPGVGV
jgi:hypothetical protein